MINVSIIVPVYNVEKYLSKCLTSLVNQTMKDIEILVINDGSPDNSQNIIDSFVKDYPDIMFSYQKENGGLGSARNYGLQYAKGDYICFVDSDDWLDLDAIENMYNIAIKENSDIVFCDMIDHFSNETQKYYNCTKFSSAYKVTPSACNKLFKRNIIKNLQFIPDVWYEDLNFTTKILFNNPRISIISRGFYHCTVRDVSTMNNNNSLKNLDMITVIEDLKNYAISQNIYDANVFYYLIFEHILVTTINRVAMQKNQDAKVVINKLIHYCKENIPNYKSNDFYKSLPLSRKIIANLNYHGLYKISKFLLSLKSKLR